MADKRTTCRKNDPSYPWLCPCDACSRTAVHSWADQIVDHAEINDLRARLARAEATCSCTSWPPEGPSPECAVHGAVRALNEATTELAGLKTELAEMDRWNQAKQAELMEAKARLAALREYLNEVEVDRSKILAELMRLREIHETVCRLAGEENRYLREELKKAREQAELK